MAPENREWGDTRIRGALSNLGHQVARGPLANVRKERGLEPAPERKKRTTWRECLAAHGDVLAAADFFTVEVWTPRGLTRVTVLVLSHLASRLQIAGISAEPGRGDSRGSASESGRSAIRWAGQPESVGSR